ncbi:MAG: hypothetical protein GWP29_03050 [Bacteroidetes bacterium]|nr:hypothetical protein [Bacteroidota bacterium]
MRLINCSKLTEWAILCCLFTVLMGCNSITSSNQDRLIARAENHYLYRSDIERNFESFASEADSLVKVGDFINNWARQKLLYEKSLINLPQEKISELTHLVDAYQNSLFINAYREFVLKSTMDTLTTQSLIGTFYEENKQNFLLKEPIYRLRYVSFPLDNVDGREITRRFKRYDTQDVKFLDSLSFQFSNYFLSDSIWLNQIEVRERLGHLDQQQQDRFLKSPNYFEVKDSLVLYLFQLAGRLDRGNVAPISYVENTISNIVFNQRKLEFLRSFDIDILQDAIKTKKFEKY